MNTSFWQDSLERLMTTLETNANGLSHAQVMHKRQVFGHNVISKSKKKHLVLLFLSKFKNPLVLMLLAAAALSSFLGDKSSFFIITTIVLLSVILDFFQEHKASDAAEKLRRSVADRTRVIRDDIEREILVSDLVPGDVVLLSAGDLVPADGRLLFQDNLYVNQSILTGESFPVEKEVRDLGEDAKDLEKATNAVFMGTSVLTGQAKMLVCVTGEQTLFGHIALSLAEKKPQTPFELGTKNFGFLLMRLTFLLVLFVIIINFFFFKPWLDTVLFALALAVGMTPEFLPMVISVTLTRGALRLSRRKVIVKRLSAIHDLGSIDILCTDKTGTLTQAKIELAQHLGCQGQNCPTVFRLAYLNSFFETGIKSPLDQAILSHTEIDLTGWSKIDEIPYDFERRRVSVLVEKEGARLLCVKGAPEDVLALSTHYESEEGTALLTAEKRLALQEMYKRHSRQGLRLLGVASAKVSHTQEKALKTDESDLVFAGFALFYDPVKEGVDITVRNLTHAKVSLKILTGDNDDVTLHLCQNLEIPVTGVLLGSQMNEMSDEAFFAQVTHCNLFCRVTPAQKKRVIDALRELGHVVGYMGDGINDAPSLQHADVGISVDNAADVAKEAADLILLRQDLGAVYDGILEGRKTFANIMKYIRMVTSSNFGNMISMAGATLFLPFLPMLPVQILLNNLMYDLSEIAIPLDNVDRDFLEKPRRWNLAAVVRFMLVMGPLSSLFDVITFVIMTKVFNASVPLFQTAWFVESLTTQILIIFVIRTRRPFCQSRPNRTLTLLSLGLVITGALIPFTPFGSYFGFVPLPLSFYGVLGGIVLVYLFLAERAKMIFYRRFPEY